MERMEDAYTLYTNIYITYRHEYTPHTHYLIYFIYTYMSYIEAIALFRLSDSNKRQLWMMKRTACGSCQVYYKLQVVRNLNRLLVL